MGPGQLIEDARTRGTRAPPVGHPCPEYRRDYVKMACWAFALLFGPALITLAVLLA